MKTLYIDESGDDNLKSVDPNYPVFVLCGVIIDNDKIPSIEKKLHAFKQAFFNNPDLIFHTADITRIKKGFECLVDKEKREQFYVEMNALMSELDYEIIACTIDKAKHKEKYGNLAFNVYEYTLRIMVQKFIYSLGDEEYGYIQCEQRNKILDNEIFSEWEKIQHQGVPFVSANKINRKIKSFSLHTKEENIGGLQLADLAATPIGRWYIGKNSKKDFEVIKTKIRKDKNGRIDGYGIADLSK